MNKRLIAAFDDCVTALEHGVSLEDCLQSYPDLAAELRPMLDAAMQVNRVMSSVETLPESQAASRERLLARSAMLHPGHNGRITTPQEGPAESAVRRGTPLLACLQNRARGLVSRPFAAAVALVILVFLAGARVVSASAHSLPGTPLYGLKLTLEQTQIDLTPDKLSRARLEGEFSERRTQEALQVIERGWSVALDFGGPLEAMDGQKWMVAGVPVIVPAGTRVEGSPQLGVYVWVRGTTQLGGTVLASLIRVEGMRFQGRVDSIQTGLWQVNGQQVLTNEDTVIEGDPETGDMVEVNIMNLPGGSMLAEHIRLISRHAARADDGQLTATMQPTDDRTPANTQAATDGQEDNHGGDGNATSEPQGTNSGKDGGLSATDSSHGGGSGNTPEPSRTPEPTRTPEPSQTPKPANTQSSGGSSGGPSTPQVKEVRITGKLQSINGNIWLVGGQKIKVDGNTEIDDNPQVGDNVEIRANQLQNGSILATRIKKKN